MLKLVKPELKEMTFRQKLLADRATMSYNRAYGGTIDFPRSRWESWYQKWVGNGDPKYFYRYLYCPELLAYVGEAAYHFEPETGRYLCDVIIHHTYRRRGFGAEGLELLCRAAKERGIQALYDDIAADNPAVELFLKCGFEAVHRDQTVCMVRKKL